MNASCLRLILDSVIFDLQRTGGISRYWYNLVDGLLKLGAAERLDLLIDTETANLWGSKLLESNSVNDSRVVIRPVRANGLSRYLSPTIRPDRAMRPTIFHSSYYRAHAASTNIVTVHDFIYEKKVGGLRAAVHSWQKRSALARAAQIICISAATQKDLFEIYPALDSNNVHVIHHGIEPVFSRGEANGGNSAEVLFVGERGGYKNFPMLVDALRTSDLKLCIVGRSLSTTERTLLESALPGRFRLVSGVRDEQLAEIYRSAFALVYPSTYEGFGMPLLEAMACGCPVIAMSCSSIPEVAGNAAILLHDFSARALSDALNGLQHNRELRMRLRELGCARASHFSWDRCVREHLAVYERALAMARD